MRIIIVAIILDGWMEECLVERRRRVESFSSCHEASSNSQAGQSIWPFSHELAAWILDKHRESFGWFSGWRFKPACIFVSDSVNVVPILIIPSAI